jgi:hypothetical protein
MEEIVVRPVPKKAEVAAIKEGKAKASIGVSSSWYEQGALVAADGAMWLLDLWSPRGNDSFYYTLSVTDEQLNRFADLPTDGFEKVDGLDTLAAAAHLTFVESKRNLLTDKPQDRNRGPGWINLGGACLANRDRSALGRLFHRS